MGIPTLIITTERKQRRKSYIDTTFDHETFESLDASIDQGT